MMHKKMKLTCFELIAAGNGTMGRGGCSRWYRGRFMMLLFASCESFRQLERHVGCDGGGTEQYRPELIVHMCLLDRFHDSRGIVGPPTPSDFLVPAVAVEFCDLAFRRLCSTSSAGFETRSAITVKISHQPQLVRIEKDTTVGPVLLPHRYIV